MRLLIKKQTRQNCTPQLSVTTHPLKCTILFLLVFSRFFWFFDQKQQNLEKTKKNKIAHLKGGVVAERSVVSFCFSVCFFGCLEFFGNFGVPICFFGGGFVIWKWF